MTYSMVTGADLALFWPEVALTLAALLVLVLDFALGRRAAALLGGLSLLGILAALALLVPYWGGNALAFNGLHLVDNYAIFFKAVFLVSVGVIVLMCMAYFHEVRVDAGEFYAILLFATLGMMLMASAADLLSLFIGLETMSISIYVLTGFFKDDQRSNEAALKYLLMGAFSTGVILYGMALLYAVSGTTNLREIARAAGAGLGNPALILAMVLLASGFGFKIAAVPFHMYIPDVYEGAPTSVAAFLSAASELAAFAVLLRVFLFAMPDLQVSWSILFAVLSVLTMTIGNVVAIAQANIKRMLAYSSIAHMGYLLIGLVVGGPLGLSAVLFYSLAYALMTLGAFAMVILLCRGEVRGEMIDDFTGLASRSPWAAAAMLIFLLSLTGVPPTAGFVGKLTLFGAAIDGGYAWLAVVAVVNSAISLYYYMYVAMVMYMREPPAAGIPMNRSPALAAALAVALLGTLVVGIYPGPFLEMARASVAGLPP